MKYANYRRDQFVGVNALVGAQKKHPVGASQHQVSHVDALMHIHLTSSGLRGILFPLGAAAATVHSRPA